MREKRIFLGESAFPVLDGIVSSMMAIREMYTGLHELCTEAGEQLVSRAFAEKTFLATITRKDNTDCARPSVLH